MVLTVYSRMPKMHVNIEWKCKRFKKLQKSFGMIFFTMTALNLKGTLMSPAIFFKSASMNDHPWNLYKRGIRFPSCPYNQPTSLVQLQKEGKLLAKKRFYATLLRERATIGTLHWTNDSQPHKE